MYRLSNAALAALAIGLCIVPSRTKAGQGGPLDAPLLADFKAFCIDTGAQPRAVAALARRRGLKRVVSNWRETRAPWPLTAWEHDVGADSVIIGSGTIPRGGEAPAASNACNVLDPVDNSRSVEGLARWIGVSPIDPKAVYSFSMQDGRLHLIDGADEAAKHRALSSGTLYELLWKTHETVTEIGLRGWSKPPG